MWKKEAKRTTSNLVPRRRVLVRRDIVKVVGNDLGLRVAAPKQDVVRNEAKSAVGTAERSLRQRTHDRHVGGVVRRGVADHGEEQQSRRNGKSHQITVHGKRTES